MKGYKLIDSFLNKTPFVSNYWTDGKKVCYFKDGTVLKNADLETFTTYGCYFARDKNSFYRCYTTIKTFDPNTLSVLNFTFAKDKNTAWSMFGLIPEADAASFAVCDQGILRHDKDLDHLPYKGCFPYGYAKDQHHIYCFNAEGKTKIVKKADPASFISLLDEGTMFGRDKNYAFFWFSHLPKADINSWGLLEPYYYYSKDSRRIYYAQREIKGVNYDTFHVIKKDAGNPFSPIQLATDEVRFFWNDLPVDEAKFQELRNKK